jgi:hypothetical protein
MARSGPPPRVYWALIGEPPWECPSCQRPVVCIGQSTWDGNVHHKDGNAWNNEPTNLVVMHTICHQHVHEKTAEIRARISATLKGRSSPTKGMKFSDEVNAKKSRPGELNPMYGKHHGETVLQKMRQPRSRETCNNCGRTFALNWVSRHKREGRCIKPSTA